MTDESKKFAFVLGRERDLCLAELRAVLTRFCFDPARRSGFDFTDLILSKNVAFINFKNTNAEQNESANGECVNFTDPVANLISVVGGTTKIFRLIPKKNNFASQISEIVSEKLKTSDSKLSFGISNYSKIPNQDLQRIGFSVKKELKGFGSLRFIESKENELSTIVSYKNNLADKGLEIAVFDREIGVLVSVTNPEEWSERDYDKPRADRRSGMLPPKLARMMLNIALGAITNNQDLNKDGKWKLEIGKSQAVLAIDPFCGSGNMLMEAAMLGVDSFGSDASEKAVEDSKANIDWLTQNSKVKNKKFNSKVKIIQTDATDPEFIENCKLKIENYDNVVVVTEPYLGEPKKYAPSMGAAMGEYAKVKDLYLGFFKNFLALKTFQTRAVFCVVFPLVETVSGTQYSLYRECVDELRKIGYTELTKPLLYGRDYQVVKREIALFQL